VWRQFISRLQFSRSDSRRARRSTSSVLATLGSNASNIGIVSYRIVSYRVVSYSSHAVLYLTVLISYLGPTKSYHIVSYRIVSYCIVSYRIVPYRIVAYRIVPYRHTVPYLTAACFCSCSQQGGNNDGTVFLDTASTEVRYKHQLGFWGRFWNGVCGASSAFPRSRRQLLVFLGRPALGLWLFLCVTEGCQGSSPGVPMCFHQFLGVCSSNPPL